MRVNLRNHRRLSGDPVAVSASDVSLALKLTQNPISKADFPEALQGL